MSKVGNIYERKLRNQLEEVGFEVVRSAASQFPDLVSWNEEEVVFIEVKRASNNKVLSNAKASFKKEATSRIWPRNSRLMLWVYYNNPIKELVWEWRDGQMEEYSGFN